MAVSPFRTGGGAGIIGPAGGVAPITPSGSNLTDPANSQEYVARALVCETAGKIDFTDADGNPRTNFPLQAGFNPVGAIKITAFTGTNLWGVKG